RCLRPATSVVVSSGRADQAGGPRAPLRGWLPTAPPRNAGADGNQHERKQHEHWASVAREAVERAAKGRPGFREKPFQLLARAFREKACAQVVHFSAGLRANRTGADDLVRTDGPCDVGDHSRTTNQGRGRYPCKRMHRCDVAPVRMRPGAPAYGAAGLTFRSEM